MTASKAFKFISILGRPGSGKGTQAELLEKKFPFEHISTGNLLRKRAKKRDFLGRKIHAILDRGMFIPTPIVFQLWMPELERLKRQKKYQGIVFDGSPRRLYEAEMLDEVLELYGWEKNFRILNLLISPKEAMRRLLKRGRSDDEVEDIKNRLSWFHTEVDPVLRYYRKKGFLVDINGEQSIENVQKEILRKLKIFLR